VTIELDVQNLIRIEAAKIGMYLWRNNNGSLPDENGRWVRYGLGNDSKAANETYKSSDLIGIWHGRFVSIECKAADWVNPWLTTNRRKPNAREIAQKNWLDCVIREGGLGCFATSWNDCINAFNGLGVKIMP